MLNAYMKPFSLTINPNFSQSNPNLYTLLISHLGTGEKKIDKTTLSANVKYFKITGVFV